MRPKPAHLGPKYAAQFEDASVTAAYRCRPPYPAETFDMLAALLPDNARAVLDLGCGTGDLARRLVERAERVDAVDPSAAMLATGKRLPGGDAARLRWLLGAAEDAPLAPPYGLITAGESIHWMDWPRLFPRLRDALASGGLLAIVERGQEPLPWDAELLSLIQRYTTNREFRPYDPIEELTSRDLFEVAGRRRTASIVWRQSLDDYVESFHSRNGFSRDRMSPADVAAFDAGVRALAASAGQPDAVELRVFATVTWGRPG